MYALKYQIVIHAPPTMIKHLSLVLLLVAATFSWLCAQQNRNELEDRRKQLLEEIKQTSRLLEDTRKSKATELNRYFALQNQIQKRRQLIQTLYQEVQSADTNIVQAHRVIRSLQEDMSRLQREYASTMRTALRYRVNQSFTLFLFSARDFSDARRRWQYIRQYYRYRQRQAEQITQMQHTLTQQTAELEKQKTEKQRLMAVQQQQQATLNAELADKDRLVQTLKSDENKLLAELNRQQKAHEQLNKTIEGIIRAEMAKKKKEARTPEALTTTTNTTVAMPTDAPGISSDFKNRKGKIPWPVSKGTITRYFGNQPHPTLQGIQIPNNGIDIRTEEGAEVLAVFEGKVSLVQFVPGFKNTVLVQHGQYFTVYSNLEDVYVKRGEQINARQPIGKIDKDKPEVHFEIWRETQRLDPMGWISAQ